MKTRAAVLHEINTPFRIETLDLESPRAGEVLVRVAAAGVCHSDWHLVSGATRHPLPVVCGHEGAGVVEAVGANVANVKPGDHVILNWAPACGHCFYCQHERPNLCGSYTDPVWAGTMLDGTPRLSLSGKSVYHYCALACFSEFAVVPKESCVPISSELPMNIAALIGCAVTTGMGAVLNTAEVKAGSSVVVFGVGGVGLSAVIGASVAKAKQIIAVDRLEPKAKTAQAFGATHALQTGDGLIDSIQSLTEGRGADYAFDTTGIPAVQEQCLEAARPGGVVVLAGLAPMGSATNFPGALLTRQEKTVMGTYYGTANPPVDFPHFAEMHLNGQIDLSRLITRTYSLDQINEAFADMLAGKLARGVIVFE